MKCIEITIDRMGATAIQTKGFQGTACRDASRAIEQLLGKKLTETLTDEFFAGVISQETQRVEQ